MRASKFSAPGAPLTVEECPVPALDAGEVLVRVMAAGVCGSDVHMWRGIVPVRQLPLTLGHEMAGTVEAWGPAVAGWGPGDQVIVRAASGCGECGACSDGRDNLCSRQGVLGMDLDGGFAQYVRAPAANLVPLPQGISFEAGAILTDAVATPYHAIVNRGGLHAGESVAVFGCGGLGVHAVQLARLLGAATIVAVDVRRPARERAERAGAGTVIDAAESSPAKEIQRLADGGVDLALDFVGKAETVSQAVRSLRPGGRAVVVGMGTEGIALPPPSLFAWREHAVLGSFGSTLHDLEQVIEFVSSGRLDLSGSITARLPLSGVNDALRILEDPVGDHVRIVIVPSEEE